MFVPYNGKQKRGSPLDLALPIYNALLRSNVRASRIGYAGNVVFAAFVPIYTTFANIHIASSKCVVNPNLEGSGCY